MTPAQIALLKQIKEGSYMPHLHADYPTLAMLYRRGLIRYGFGAVEITEDGRNVLADLKEQANG